MVLRRAAEEQLRLVLYYPAQDGGDELVVPNVLDQVMNGTHPVELALELSLGPRRLAEAATLKSGQGVGELGDQGA